VVSTHVCDETNGETDTSIIMFVVCIKKKNGYSFPHEFFDYIHTYHSRLIAEGVAKVSKIFL
jgi:hypothetical protein